MQLFHTQLIRKDLFADAEVVRGNFEQLVLTQELQCSFDRHLARRNQTQCVIRTGRTVLVSCFFLQTLTEMSSLLGVQPITMPS